MKAIKTLFFLAVISACATLSGCAADQNGLVLDQAGPPMAPTRSQDSANGTLLVYSAYEVNADFNARDPNRPEHSNYTILTAAGKLLKKVHNNSGTILQEAVPVALPPGQYNVRALANGYGFVTIPVIIGAKRTTVLHLEGGGGWQNESVFNQTNAVRLPDGRAIGWRG